jgi:tRNA(Met) C34 N-acetyltransferase TmcA
LIECLRFATALTRSHRLPQTLALTFVFQIQGVWQCHRTKSPRSRKQRNQTERTTRFVTDCESVFNSLNVEIVHTLSAAELNFHLTPFDLKRLGAYANNQLDYHVVLDLMPTVAKLFFESRLGDNVKPTAVQSAILLALGLQRKSIEDVEVCYHLIVIESTKALI